MSDPRLEAIRQRLLELANDARERAFREPRFAITAGGQSPEAGYLEDERTLRAAADAIALIDTLQRERDELHAPLDGCGQHEGVRVGQVCGECQLARAEQLEAQVSRLTAERDAAKMGELSAMAEAVNAFKHSQSAEAALRKLLDRYVGLVNSGDAGFWDPEKEPEVQAARALFAAPFHPASAIIALASPDQEPQP